jgi:hypothetical protein
MRLTVSIFALPKRGNTDDEYEDAFYPQWQGERVLDRVRLAVADGATEGSFSRVWAQMLARSFHATKSLRFEDVFDRALRNWDEWLPGYLRERESSGRPVLWFEEAKLERGAFATFLGLRLRTRTEHAGHWAAVALGDSCLFHVRGDDLVYAFPLDRPEAFDTSPPLVPSRPDDVGLVTARAERAAGEWLSGDSFYLATDALAAWFLAAHEAREKPWRALSDLDTDVSMPFADWVAELREDDGMRNDDVTLTRVDIH